jgi:hypothetical protein
MADKLQTPKFSNGRLNTHRSIDRPQDSIISEKGGSSKRKTLLQRSGEVTLGTKLRANSLAPGTTAAESIMTKGMGGNQYTNLQIGLTNSTYSNGTKEQL